MDGGAESSGRCTYCNKRHSVGECVRKALGMPRAATPQDLIKEAERQHRSRNYTVKLPMAESPPALDHWIKRKDTWVRVHQRQRLALCSPMLVEGGPVAAGYTLLPRRTTEVRYEGSDDTEVIEDDWRNPNDAHRPLEKRWCGETYFELSTGEWRIYVHPPWRRALMKPEGVQGIELFPGRQWTGRRRTVVRAQEE